MKFQRLSRDALCSACLIATGPLLAQRSIVGNLATRASVGVGESAAVVGFIVSGTSQDVVLRAIGPSLAPFGIEKALMDDSGTARLHWRDYRYQR